MMYIKSYKDGVLELTTDIMDVKGMFINSACVLERKLTKLNIKVERVVKQVGDNFYGIILCYKGWYD